MGFCTEAIFRRDSPRFDSRYCVAFTVRIDSGRRRNALLVEPVGDCEPHSFAIDLVRINRFG